MDERVADEMHVTRTRHTCGIAGPLVTVGAWGSTMAAVTRWSAGASWSFETGWLLRDVGVPTGFVS
jgi:hypothetical protein